MNEKINRLANWANQNVEFPITMELNPTNRCNLSCTSCWQREFEINYDEMPTERLIEIVREAAKLGIKEIRIPGAGEPLLKKDLIEVMAEIKKHDINGLLITNGIFLSKDVCKKIVDMKWDCLTVSIDGADSKTHDFLRGKQNAFETTKKNLIWLNEIKTRSKSNYPYLRFNTVISNKNYTVLDRIIEFGYSVGCQDCQFQPMTVWGKDGKTIELDSEQKKDIQKYLPIALDTAKKCGIKTNIDDFMNTKLVENASENMDKLFKKSKKSDNPFLNLPCFEPWYNIIVLPNGKVAPCSIAGDRFDGDLNESTLKELWLGKDFKDIRRRLLSGDLTEYCKKCCSVVHLESERIKTKLAEVI